MALSAPAIASPAVASDVHFRFGFVPLIDAASLVVAAHGGFFAKQGLQVELVPCASWASLRDRLAFGVLQGAAMLSPMPIATNLGLGGICADLRVIGTLSHNGNSIVLSSAMLQEMRWAAPGLCDQRPLQAKALAAALAARREAGRDRPTLAVVFPFSSHNYLLREWLANGGIDPERDVRLVVVPPPQVAERLAAGEIDGFCAGQPWGTRAVELRAGEIVACTADIWPDHPEKIFAASAETLQHYPNAMAAALAAIAEAGVWLDSGEVDHLTEAARMMCNHGGLAMPAASVVNALGARMLARPDQAPKPMPPFHFSRVAPQAAHGRRWLAEMRRWGHVPDDTEESLIDTIWQTQIWQAATTNIAAPNIAAQTSPPQTSPPTQEKCDAS
jgi:two-component system, oxyanion-binding sensor